MQEWKQKTRYIELKYVMLLLVMLNIFDSITTSCLISKTNIYIEANLFLLYLFERFDYNFILFLKTLVFTFVCLITYRSITNISSYHKYYNYIVCVFIILVIFMFLVVFGSIYMILKL